MSHPIHRVLSFKVESPYTLRVRFDDGTHQVIDFRPVLALELYQPLQDLAVFNQVRLDPEVHTLVWPNGADFDPATLHDWPKYVDALAARATAIGLYRRSNVGDTWHWCRNCSAYPTSNFEEKRTKPKAGELCNECMAKQKAGICQK